MKIARAPVRESGAGAHPLERGTKHASSCMARGPRLPKRDLGAFRVEEPEFPKSPRPAHRFPLNASALRDELPQRHGPTRLAGPAFASSTHGVPRQTIDVDLVVQLSESKAGELVRALQGEFYGDEATARESTRLGGSFNLIHLRTGIKVDIFVCGPSAFDLEEFRRQQPLRIDAQSDRTVFMKSPEDTLLRKLLWYRAGGEVSDRQWSDVLGIVRTQGARLDRDYLTRWATTLDILDLLERVLA